MLMLVTVPGRFFSQIRLQRMQYYPNGAIRTMKMRGWNALSSVKNGHAGLREELSIVSLRSFQGTAMRKVRT